MRRAWRVPEALQASASDCGPAALQALAAGLGLRLRLDRLREACQTDVDGTSIDALEDLARELGLDAEQVMLPAEHVLLAPAAALPAIAVVRRPGGLTHFIVVWRVWAGRAQVMDPAGGRAWISAAALRASLHLHEQAVPRDAWREWAAGDEFRGALAARLRALDVAGRDAAGLVAQAASDPSWAALGALDAGTRALEQAARRESLRRGEARDVLADLLRRVAADPSTPLPRGSASVSPLDGGALLLRGAVLLRVRGRRDVTADDGADGSGASVRRARLVAQEPSLRPWIAGALRAAGRSALVTLAAALVVAAMGAGLEGLLFALLLDPAAWGLPPLERGTLLLATPLLLAALVTLDLAGAWTFRRFGRRLEAELRAAFLRAVPRLGEPYLRGRPRADLIERSHAAVVARELPSQAAHAGSAGARLLVTLGALAWLYPRAAPYAAAATLVAVTFPLVAQRRLAELELRLRALGAALAAFPLEALLGLVPLRAHGVERAWRREHDDVLARWLETGFARQRRAVALHALQWALGSALLAAAVAAHARAQGAAGLLLLAYWGLRLPDVGAELGQAFLRLPRQRAALRRLLEPIEAERELPPRAPSRVPAPVTRGAHLSLLGVTLTLGGRRVLDGLDLELPPGRHVALLGASGAGKSTLVGLLLGWHAPAAGEWRIDGRPADEDALARLRAATAWVDPGVRLWNRSLHENLRFGAPDAATDLGATLAACGAAPLVERLPDGLRTRLGEGGTLVAGGEGQRLRLARALLREGVRLALLDEPFRGLPRDERLALQRLARQHWAATSLLCVTHDVESSAEFDEVWLLADGRLVERGAPRDLLAGDTAYARLLRAERDLRAALAEDARVRRLRLEAGVLREEIA